MAAVREVGMGALVGRAGASEGKAVEGNRVEEAMAGDSEAEVDQEGAAG